MNALTESGGSSSGAYTVPSILSAQLIDLFRAKSQVITAGAQTIRLDAEAVSFAKLAQRARAHVGQRRC